MSEEGKEIEDGSEDGEAQKLCYPIKSPSDYCIGLHTWRNGLLEERISYATIPKSYKWH